MREQDGDDGASAPQTTKIPRDAAAEARLFDALCELDGDALTARLRAIEHDDPALAARLRRLLEIDAEYAEHTARMVAGEDMPDATQRIGDGDDIGAFRLLRKIGRGGMGVVYLAERRSGFVQQVAIKLMPRFAIDARSRERFAQERRLLAQLRHPNVCSILDGGELDDGTPWLAMEYVQGESLCAWCARHAVPLRERIELFLQLCDAVQYAHQQLVIHRDLKDNNVLIETIGNGRATVKLLDFGIAKSLEETSEDNRTAAQDRFFSPMTAAPEQIRGERATVSVDVYALGALLHQLLCGFLPFAHPRRDPAELQRAILELVPPKMSDALERTNSATGTQSEQRQPTQPPVPARALQGELDAIVAHCLRKAPEERYDDVGALARDLRAWLSGHPISISNDDRFYRIGKFVRRNRAPVALTAATALSVLAALGITLWQAAELREQRDAAKAAQQRSEIDRDRARAVAGFMRDTFEQADPGKASEGGLLARELIERGKRRLDRLGGQQDVQAELALLLAESDAGMGLVQESDAIYRAHATAIDTLSSTDPKLQWRARLLRVSNDIVLGADSPRLDAELVQLQRLADTPDAQVQLAYQRQRLYARRSQFELAASTLEDAWRRYASGLGEDSKLRLQIDLARALISAERKEDARRISGSIDRDALYRQDPDLQIRALSLIAYVMREHESDRAALAEVIARWQRTAERLYGSESLPAARAYLWAVGVTENTDEQDALMRKGYDIQIAKTPPISSARAEAEYNMAIFYLDLRERPDLAEPHLAKAVEIGRSVSSRGHADVSKFERTWARTLNGLGRYRECLDRLSDPPGQPEAESDAKTLSELRLELAKANIALGRTPNARAEAAAITALWQRLGKKMPDALAKSLQTLMPPQPKSATTPVSKPADER
ncbi:MAG: serine/threonine protein kinase [Xanthomonadaceae bacterium]|nr:serine/threonine protein kinase [Xanthomonadaceae bacterium]